MGEEEEEEGGEDKVYSRGCGTGTGTGTGTDTGTTKPAGGSGMDLSRARLSWLGASSSSALSRVVEAGGSVAGEMLRPGDWGRERRCLMRLEGSELSLGSLSRRSMSFQCPVLDACRARESSERWRCVRSVSRAALGGVLGRRGGHTWAPGESASARRRQRRRRRPRRKTSTG